LVTPPVPAHFPNVGSIRVLEKLGFRREMQFEAYGSPEMYLHSRELVAAPGRGLE
jgi:RimJ/RimL family protein N-acetyltransferase